MPASQPHTNTTRVQDNHIMSLQEKQDFFDAIQRMPWLYQDILTALQPWSKHATSLLDVGCGNGHLLELIHAQFPHLTLHGSDADPYMIKQLQQKPYITPHHQTAEALTVTADVIVCNLAFHHFADPRLSLATLLQQTNQAVIVVDQVRPETEEDLTQRMKKRAAFLGQNDTPYYQAHERASILEAYSKTELTSLFSDLPQHTLTFVNHDYYERFILVIPTTEQTRL